MNRYIHLTVALMLVGVIALPTEAALTFSATKKPTPRLTTVTQYLDASNPSLRRALDIHNLLYQMPALREAMQTAKDVADQKDVITKQLKSMNKCHSQKLGNVFKDPDLVWDKMVGSYESNRQVATPQDDKVIRTQVDQQNEQKRKFQLSRQIMMDVYQNPTKWGETQKDGAFPLWKDQAIVYDQQWNDFYTNMNKTLGLPEAGRPQIDEQTRHNAQRYDDVLKAHQAYLNSAGTEKARQFKALPPKAPEALPSWKEIVMVDGETGQLYPEMPELWKDPKVRQQLAQNNPEGELNQVLTNGDVNTPTQAAINGSQSILEEEYNMRLALDSLSQGYTSLDNTMQQMQQKFIQKLANVGLNVTEANLINRGQYVTIQKQLREAKKNAIAEAKEYIDLLDKQDQAYPQLLKKQQNAMKKSRMSAKAQEAVADDNTLLQISQMSPATQQKLVIVALEKDTDALVHLTETNAMDVDQRMKEREATNKIIKESQQQVQTVLQEQIKGLPAWAECPL